MLNSTNQVMGYTESHSRTRTPTGRTFYPQVLTTRRPQKYNRLSGETVEICPVPNCNRNFTLTRNGVRSPGVDQSHFLQHLQLDQTCIHAQHQMDVHCVREVLDQLPYSFRSRSRPILLENFDLYKGADLDYREEESILDISQPDPALANLNEDPNRERSQDEDGYNGDELESFCHSKLCWALIYLVFMSLTIWCCMVSNNWHLKAIISNFSYSGLDGLSNLNLSSLTNANFSFIDPENNFIF